MYRRVCLMKKTGFGRVTALAATVITVLGVAVTSVSADTQSDLDSVKTQISDTQTKISDGQKALEKLQSQESAASQQIATLKQNIEARSAQLAKQARSAQLNDASSMLEFVSNSDSITEAVSRTVTVATVVHANDQALADQKSDKEKLAQKQSELKKAAKEQKTKNEQLLNDRASLAVQQTTLEVKKAKEDSEAKAAAEAAQKAAEEAAKQVASASSTTEAENAVTAAESAASSVSTSSSSNTSSTSSSTSSSSTSTSSATSTSSTSASSSSVDTSSVVNMAVSLTKLNIPYVYGGSSLSGMDCSGLTQYVYAKFGVSLARTAAGQAAQTTRISVSQAQAGDLLFWTEGGSVYHVAIYIGGGQYVHAPHTGTVVQTGSISSWAPAFAGRIN